MKAAIIAGCVVLFLATGAAHAVGTCAVADPTGTPLNIRNVTATVREIAPSCQHKMRRANTAKDKPETTMTRFFIADIAALSVLSASAAHAQSL